MTLEGISSRSVKAVLKDARCVLSSVADSPQKRAQVVATPTGSTDTNSRGGDFLVHCAELVKEFHRLLLNGTSFEFKDWTLVKAVTELVVRWGIYPYLSPGVGIPLQKRFGDKAASAAANAVSDYLRGPDTLGKSHEANFEGELSAENSNLHPLVFSADLLSFIVLETIILAPGDTSQKGTVGLSGDASKISEKVAGAAEDEDEFQGKYTPAVESSPGALRHLVLSHNLIDILGALLQIAHDEQLDLNSWKEEALKRIKGILARLPVDYVVEALFILLGQDSSITPPAWLKPEVGKLLSQVVVMRTGGLSTVMERLVGGAESGSVHVYDRVAAHLAKVPRYVSTKDGYYKAVCTELRMLLFLSDTSYVDRQTSKAHRNMHHTSITLACILAHQEPSLTEKYLLRPIVEPLLGWSQSETQSQVNAVEGEKNISSVGPSGLAVPALLDGLHVLRLLLTAGHDKAFKLREQLLRLISPLIPNLILLKYLIWPSYGKLDVRRFEVHDSVARSRVPKVVENVDKLPQKKDQKGSQRKDFQAGFFEGKRLYDIEEGEERTKGTVGHLMGCISDIVGWHLTQPALHVVPILFNFLFDLSTGSLSWPSTEGEIAYALQAGKEQADSSATFLSKLLLAGEYWELTVALLVSLLRKILWLRKATRVRSTMSGEDQMITPNIKYEAVLPIVQTFEVMYVDVGTEAVEKDPAGALRVLKILLDDDELLKDRELLELVLPLLQSAVSRLHQDQKCVDDDETGSALKREEQSDLLNSLGMSLKMLTASSKVPKESRDYAASLRSMIAQHVANISNTT